jgi:prepilin-type N-terminal cleavage/methylation domain-containing protein
MICDLRFTICRKSVEFSAFNRQSSIINHKFRRAFSLIEMLVVLAILGIMAALAVPALKNFGHADAMIAAAQQLRDDAGRARQLAISQRTTVYMVFVPTNFWASPWTNPNWTNSLTPGELAAAVNLCDKQLTGYTFATLGAVGDQPGQHRWHYLAPWQTLPDGTFIALQKFAGTNTFADPINPISGAKYVILPFIFTNNIPFPTATNVVDPPSGRAVYLPYIAFNYLGQLISEVDALGNYRDAYITLARGSIVPAIDPSTRAFQLNPPQVAEVPPGNSTNAYNIIHIDWLTGRATLEEPKVQ